MFLIILKGDHWLKEISSSIFISTLWRLSLYILLICSHCPEGILIFKEIHIAFLLDLISFETV
jgi:hypothetical protein